MGFILRRQPAFQAAAISHTRSFHDVTSIVLRVGSMIVGCLAMLMGLISGGAYAASGDRKIVVFQDGTSVQVQQQVVEQSGSRVLHLLSLINGVAIELATENAAQALIALQSDPTVVGIYDDLSQLRTGWGRGQCYCYHPCRSSYSRVLSLGTRHNPCSRRASRRAGPKRLWSDSRHPGYRY